MVVHTLASYGRLADVIDGVEQDPRIQMVFTVAPDVFNHSVRSHLRAQGALTVPWEQAVRERFDLALAASYGGLADLHAPVVLMAHGAGHGKLVRRRDGGRPLPATAQVYGLDPQRLCRDGQALAAALLLAHDGECDVLRRQCPQALPTAVVTGDPCYDRLVASIAWRERYRAALGVGAGQNLVVVCSTWGRDGVFGSVPDLLPRILDGVAAKDYRVAALLHPGVWEAHGVRQIRAWTHECRAAGLILPGPADDWRAVVVAADNIIGDHGSVTAYAAAIGKPVLLLAGAPSVGIATGSAQHLLAATAARLDASAPLPAQLHSAPAVDSQAVAAAVSSRPGQADLLIRRVVYQALRLPEPASHRGPTPVSVPRLPTEVTW